MPTTSLPSLKEFDLPREKTRLWKMPHWDLGQTWND